MDSVVYKSGMRVLRVLRAMYRQLRAEGRRGCEYCRVRPLRPRGDELLHERYQGVQDMQGAPKSIAFFLTVGGTGSGGGLGLGLVSKPNFRECFQKIEKCMELCRIVCHIFREFDEN